MIDSNAPNWLKIAERPTAVMKIPDSTTGVHESTLRAYVILEEVKGLLQMGTPGTVILKAIEVMEYQSPPY